MEENPYDILRRGEGAPGVEFSTCVRRHASGFRKGEHGYDRVEQDLDRLRPEASGEHLAVVGQISSGMP